MIETMLLVEIVFCSALVALAVALAIRLQVFYAALISFWAAFTILSMLSRLIGGSQ